MVEEGLAVERPPQGKHQGRRTRPGENAGLIRFGPRQPTLSQASAMHITPRQASDVAPFGITTRFFLELRTYLGLITEALEGVRRGSNHLPARCWQMCFGPEPLGIGVSAKPPARRPLRHFFATASKYVVQAVRPKQ